ncbi:MAG: PqqD family protein [Desulfobacterales bacterium]|nr:PqqD family protein [Desulfobacterales bacterium]
MDLTQKFKKNKDIVYKEEGDGAFLFDPATGNLKYMNRSGKETFLSLNDQQDLNQAVNYMLGQFPDENRRRIEKDLEPFIKELEENGFLFPLHRE